MQYGLFSPLEYNLAVDMCFVCIEHSKRIYRQLTANIVCFLLNNAVSYCADCEKAVRLLVSNASGYANVLHSVCLISKTLTTPTTKAVGFLGQACGNPLL